MNTPAILRRAQAVLIAMGLMAAAPALAQEPTKSTLSGTVVSETSGLPLGGAIVTIDESGDTTLTNDQGVYQLSVAPGTYTVRVQMVAYTDAEQSVTVAAGAPATADFKLPDDPRFAEVIVVVGSRTPRTQLETPAPVDVIPEEAIREAPAVELNQVMDRVVPSYKATHQTIADGTDHINPASLRGLGPDQVLVLVNGKRRHSSALVNVNGTFGRGTVAVDLNSIPTSAIKRIEVLRDGAASQYGSDAIAGVVNIVLKDYVDVLDFSTTAGITASGDGEQFKAGGNYGFKLGQGGYVNLSAEIVSRGKTNRADPWAGQIFPGIEDDLNTNDDNAATDAELARRGQTREDYTMEVGQSAALMGTLFLNAMYPIRTGVEAYAFGGYTYRKGYATGFYRLPYQERQVDLRVYPNGFLPEINPEIMDWSAGGGVRAAKGAWRGDLSVNHGGNSFHYFVDNSINASFGLSSPTSFDSGQLGFSQTSINADSTYTLDGVLESLALAAGAEARFENYQITAGQPFSYQLGNETTASGEPKAPGAQVFPGFRPSNEVDEWRQSQSVYAGVESQLTKRVFLDVGGRFENYDDFGSTLIGKAAGRVDLLKSDQRNVAVRGAVSTGFRAPSLHQVWFSTVSTQFVNVTDENGMTSLQPREIITSYNSNPITKAFGIPDLEEETSVNVSAGITARPMKNLSLSVDFYQIDITDRIVLTSQFSRSNETIGEEVTAILAEFPEVSAAQFFANAVDTSTRGMDLVADYRLPLQQGNLDFVLAANLTATEVTDVNLPGSVVERFGADNEEAVKTIFFNREEQGRLEDALPKQKGSLGVRYGYKKLNARLVANYFGGVDEKGNNPDLDESFGAKVLFDTDVSYQLGTWKLTVGANNLLNTFPDRQELPQNTSGGRFVYSRRTSQFSTNGGFYYLRLQYLL